MSMGRIFFLVCVGLASLIFMAASGVSMRKGYLSASTLQALVAMACALVFVVTL